MTVMTLMIEDVGDGEVEVRVNGMPEDGSMAAEKMKEIIAWLESESFPDEYTRH